MKFTTSLSNSDQQYGSIDGANHVNGTANSNWFSHKKPLIGFAAAALALLGTGMVVNNKLTVLDAKIDDMVNRQAVTKMSDRAHVSMMDHHKARASTHSGVEKQDEDPCDCFKDVYFLYNVCSVNGSHFDESNFEQCVSQIKGNLRFMNEDGKACAYKCLASPCDCLEVNYPFFFNECSMNGAIYQKSSREFCVGRISKELEYMNEKDQVCANQCLASL